MWGEIVEMFTTMQWYIYVPLIVGVLLLIAECFIPGFGVAGVSGLVAIAGAIIAQGVLHRSIVQVLFLLAICFVVIMLLFIIFIRSAKYGLIGKTPFVENKTAVPVDYDDKNKNELRGLIGQRGVTTTRCQPAGKFVIDDQVFEGMTAGESLEKDTIIKIVDVEGNRIKIEKVEV